MERKIIPNTIIEISYFMLEEIENLYNVKCELLNEINSLTNIYSGVDSTIIISKYSERVSKLDIVINNYLEYAKYIYKISTAYQDNFDKYQKRFDQLLEKINFLNNEYTGLH